MESGLGQDDREAVSRPSGFPVGTGGARLSDSTEEKQQEEEEPWNPRHAEHRSAGTKTSGSGGQALTESWFTPGAVSGMPVVVSKPVNPLQESGCGEESLDNGLTMQGLDLGTFPWLGA